MSNFSCRNVRVPAADLGFSPAWGLQHHRLTPVHRIVRTRGWRSRTPSLYTTNIVADAATPLLFSSRTGILPLNRSLFCWTTLSLVWVSVVADVWTDTGASLWTHVHEEVLPKTNPKNQKEQRTKNEREKRSRYFVGGIQCTRYRFGVMFWAVSSVGGTLLAVPFGR